MTVSIANIAKEKWEEKHAEIAERFEEKNDAERVPEAGNEDGQQELRNEDRPVDKRPNGAEWRSRRKH